MEAARSLTNLYPALIAGVTASAHAAFCDRATIDTPLGGRQLPPEWITAERSWLAAHDATVKAGLTATGTKQLAHEFILGLDVDRRRVALPVLLIADTEEGCLRDLRVYHSTWPISGSHMTRGPLREPDSKLDQPAILAEYEQALSVADVAAVDALFEEEGYVREPSGDDFTHAGDDRMEFYGPLRKVGGVTFTTVSTVTEGSVTAIEYICSRWGDALTAPQAGAAVCEFGPTGKISAIRIYDDITIPE